MSFFTYSKIKRDYGTLFTDTKLYNNNVIMLTFSDSSKIMWFKRIMRETYGYQVKDCTLGRTYWFEPI